MAPGFRSQQGPNLFREIVAGIFREPAAHGEPFGRLVPVPALLIGEDHFHNIITQLAEGTSLKALAEVIAGAKCLLGVDTGLTHLGAALGIPSVGIIVGTSAELFSLVSENACATVGDKGVVPQPEEVLAAMHSVLAQSVER